MTFNLHIIFINATVHISDVLASDTVANIKAKIHDKKDVPPHCQTFA